MYVLYVRVRVRVCVCMRANVCLCEYVCAWYACERECVLVSGCY